MYIYIYIYIYIIYYVYIYIYIIWWIPAGNSKVLLLLIYSGLTNLGPSWT